MTPGEDNRRFAPADTVSWTDTGGEFVVFDRGRGTYHALNGAASAIWRALGAGQPVEAVVDALSRQFQGDRDAIAADVEALLSSGLASGLIVEVV